MATERDGEFSLLPGLRDLFFLPADYWLSLSFKEFSNSYAVSWRSFHDLSSSFRSLGKAPDRNGRERLGRVSEALRRSPEAA